MAASSTAYRCTKSIPKQISASSHLKSLLQIPKWDSFLPASASVTTCPTGPDHKHVSERSADLGCNPLLEPELSFLTSTTYIHKMLWYRLSHRWESTWMRCFLLWFHSSNGRVRSLSEGLQDEANWNHVLGPCSIVYTAFPEELSHTCTATRAQ